MSRVFTVHFPFKGKTFSAIVSFKQEDVDLCFLIRYLDEDLEECISGRKVVVSLSEGIKSPSQLNKIGEDLVFNTTEAISNHLYLAD
jgi:hypothetical protein